MRIYLHKAILGPGERTVLGKLLLNHTKHNIKPLSMIAIMLDFKSSIREYYEFMYWAVFLGCFIQCLAGFGSVLGQCFPCSPS